MMGGLNRVQPCCFCGQLDCNGMLCLLNDAQSRFNVVKSFQAQLRQYQIPPVPAPKPSLLQAGIKVEDLVGWRIWGLTLTGMLKSYARLNVWLPGEIMEGVPGDYDSKGVWAFRERGPAEAKLHANPAHVLGRVKLWGQVVEHQDGFRAQFARIVALDAVNLPGQYPWSLENERALAWLRKTYGVPGEE